MALYGFPRDQARTLRGVAQSAKARTDREEHVDPFGPDPLVGRKPLIRFTLGSDLTVNDATSTLAVITDQYGTGYKATADVGNPTCTLTNTLISTGDYLFSGVSGAAGLAQWDTGNTYVIIQMECV